MGGYEWRICNPGITPSTSMQGTLRVVTTQKTVHGARSPTARWLIEGAGDGTRTRDSLLGKQVLYQLSYPRNATDSTESPGRLSNLN